MSAIILVRRAYLEPWMRAPAELGRVRLKEGRMPEKTGEIAMTEELLSVLGQDQKTGDPITLYVAGGDWQVEKITCTLSGILDSYGGGWNKKGYPIVSSGSI